MTKCGECSNKYENSVTVLIIEDEAAYTMMMQTALKKTGFKVVCVNDALVGMEAVLTIRPSVILLDILLPSRDGFSFLAEIKTMDDFRKIPVIILSNLDEPCEVARGRKLGAYAYLCKYNTNPNEIIDKIYECLPR